MSIEWNKVTWYSKILAVVLFVATFYIGYALGQQKKEISQPNKYPTPASKTGAKAPRVSIKKEDIKEDNFSGTKSVVAGTSPLVPLVNKFVDDSISEFQKMANKDVPAMRKEFGPDSPTASYEIDIDAKYIKGPKTESIVQTDYTYTGGAHGSSAYTVFTISLASGKLLALSSVIKNEEQNAFTQFVKKELNAWQAQGGDSGAMLFPDSINDLKFSDFDDWSLDDKNLIIYFDQYAIAAGAQGEVAFTLPITKVNSFLNDSYK